MYFAVDNSGRRISADIAERGHEYFCPLCSGPVILRRGEIKEAHFAHEKAACLDNWNYDMSEWHYWMQSRFPPEQREVVVKHKGEVHRADILHKNCVIEFQHSPISAGEIYERNNFYQAAGFNVAWVFDLQDSYDAGRIVDCDYSGATLYKWSHPKASLRSFPPPRENEKGLVLYFYWMNEDGGEEFHRIIWSTRDDVGDSDFKKFISSCWGFDPDEPDEALAVEYFFITKQDRVKACLSNLKCRYNIKYGGVKGKPRNAYICPRRPDSFGIPPFGEKACRYCRYCAAVEQFSNGFRSYCCYPHQLHEVNEYDPDYECSGVPIF